VRVRVRLAGICNTDLELLRGYYGFAGIAGHEFVGEVEGRRVVGEINLACGKCPWCQRRLGRHCPHRTVLGIVRHPGAFATHLTLPAENLLPVPKDVPDEYAVFTEPIAAACEILEQVRFPRGASVAVLGDGKLGLLIAQVLRLHGLRVTAFGRHSGKLAILQPLDIHTVLVTRDNPRLPNAAFPYVVDATGSAAGFAAALDLIEPWGTLILKSTVADRVPVDMARVIVNEITLVGSRCGRFAPALKLLRGGGLSLAPMIGARYPLSEAPAAFAKAQEPGVLKVLLQPEH
jgi:alcohol dehydrogenase